MKTAPQTAPAAAKKPSRRNPTLPPWPIRIRRLKNETEILALQAAADGRWEAPTLMQMFKMLEKIDVLEGARAAGRPR